FLNEIDLNDEWFNFTYKDFLEKICYDDSVKKKFLYDIMSTLKIFVTKKYDSNRVIGKMFIDNIRIYYSDYGYKIITNSIRKMLTLHFCHSSIYTNKTQLSAFIQDSLIKYGESISMDSEIPKIFFKCCSDILIAEILVNFYKNCEDLTNKKIAHENLTNEMNVHMKMFLKGELEITKNVSAFRYLSGDETLRIKNEVDRISMIFFGINWYKTNDSEENQRFKFKKIKKQSKNILNNFSQICCNNNSFYRKLFQKMKKSFKCVSKCCFNYPEDENYIISNLIKSKFENKTVLLINFVFFDIDRMNDKNTLFFEQMNLIKNTICNYMSPKTFEKLIQNYKEREIFGISSVIMNKLKKSIKNIFPRCKIIESKKKNTPNFQLICIED
ncbi:hypothetical protein EDEG_03139, partial [Edhazardia aedis USNM 41457]